MGVAGPVSVDGGSVAGEVPPLATTEGALLASVNPRLLGHQQRRRLTARVLKSGMTRAPVFRVADVAEAEALVSWTRDNFAALLEGRGGDDEPRRTPRRDAVRRRQLGVPIPLRHQGRDGDEHGHHRHRAVCGGVVEAETAAASLVALSGNLCFDNKARRHQRRRGARPERHRRRSNPAQGRRRTPAHHARSGRGTQHTQEPGRLREAASLGFNAHVANVVAAMFLATGRDEGRRSSGRERHHDRRGAGRRPLRLGLHRLPRSRHRRRRHETPTQSGASISSASAAGGDPPAPTPTPSPDASPSVPSRANSLPSLRARLAAPLQRPRRTRSVTAWGLLSDRDS